MFRVRNQTARRALVIIIMLAIVSGSAIGALVSARATDRTIRSQLRNRALTVASLLDQQQVAQLTGKSSDTTAPYYVQLKSTLAGVKRSNPDIRVAYLTIERAGKLYFYVDSETPNSNYYSPPGQYYPDATPFFKNVFVSGQSGVEGPSKDNFGTWVSGLAPVYADGSGKLLGVLGIDIDATNYYHSIVQSAIIPLLVGALALGVVASYEWIRLRDQRFLKVQSELVSIASHELRSPLAGIRWAAENLAAQLDTGKRKTAESILASATNLQASIDDILQISNFGTKRHNRLELGACDLSALVKEVCETQHLVAAQSGIKLVLDKHFNIPIPLQCDQNRIKRALHNLVSNAIKYAKADSSVTIGYSAPKAGHRLTISDHGIGIPVAEQSKVFKGFYRASNAKASSIPGTGLGLYLTRSIIEQHGGTISLDSSQDVGTKVSITLPGR